MQIGLPFETLLLLHRLQSAGHQVYLVGGAVRDALLGRLSAETDYDFTTDATPEQLQALLPESFYNNAFGTVSIHRDHLRQQIGVLPGTATPALSEQPAHEAQRQKVIDLESATKLHLSLQARETTASRTDPNRAIPDIESGPDNLVYEVTTYRAEGRYTDHRRPDQVKWGSSLADDLSRRDFTINAMAIEVTPARVAALVSPPLAVSQLDQPVWLDPADYQVIDPYQGQADLAAGVLRSVGEPAARFEEDALRMLRAIRFSVQLNFRMTDETFTAIAGLADQVQYVSWERIRDEVLKMLRSPFPAEAIELLDDTGLLHYILPELREGKGIEQGGHHTTDVWTHSLDALAACPSTDPIVRFATLLHDIAKPRTLRYVDGDPTFYNHEVVGARLARRIGERFRLSRRDIDRLFILVRHHMFYYQPHNTDASIRRFMRKVGLENINDILDLREGDRLGSGARKTSWRLEELKQRMIAQLHQPFAVTDLVIDGHDVMTSLQMQPGPVIGRLLHQLFEEVLDDPAKNTREYLLERLHTLYKEEHAQVEVPPESAAGRASPDQAATSGH